MSTNQIIGGVVAIVGIVLLFMAYQASQAPLEKVSDALTGRFTDRTTWLMVGGIAATAGGALFALFGRR